MSSKLNLRQYSKYTINSFGTSLQSVSNGVTIFFSNICWYLCCFESERIPCHGRLPRKKDLHHQYMYTLTLTFTLTHTHTHTYTHSHSPSRSYAPSHSHSHSPSQSHSPSHSHLHLISCISTKLNRVWKLIENDLQKHESERLQVVSPTLFNAEMVIYARKTRHSCQMPVFSVAASRH